MKTNSFETGISYGLENKMFRFVKKKDYDLLEKCVKNKEFILHGTQLMLKEQEKQTE